MKLPLLLTSLLIRLHLLLHKMLLFLNVLSLYTEL